MFRRSTAADGSTPEPETPYQKAAQVWDERIGSGRVHVLVKPIAEGLRTNLVITTDRRVYCLELQSTPETYMASVSWRYPQDELLALERRNTAAEAAAEQVIDAASTSRPICARSSDGSPIILSYASTPCCPGAWPQGRAPPA